MIESASTARKFDFRAERLVGIRGAAVRDGVLLNSSGFWWRLRERLR